MNSSLLLESMVRSLNFSSLLVLKQSYKAKQTNNHIYIQKIKNMITPTQKIEIPISKEKLIKLLIGSLVFVTIGLWFVIGKPTINNAIFSNPAVVFGMGIVSIVFSSVSIFIMLKKLKDTKPGFVIDDTGVTDNSSAVSAGHIPWADITAIKTAQVFTQKFIIIIVNNPEDYINQQTSVLKRENMKMNLKSYGSPITITASTLKYNFTDLENILRERLKSNT
jgi:hypothetical protein